MQIQLFCCQLSGLTDVYKCNATHFFSTILRWLSSKWIKFSRGPQCLKITEKSLIQHCKRSELHFTFQADKIWSLRSKSVTREANLKWTKMLKNPKLKCDILSDFQTMCRPNKNLLRSCQFILDSKWSFFYFWSLFWHLHQQRLNKKYPKN